MTKPIPGARRGRPPKPKAPWKLSDNTSFDLLRRRFSVALRAARIAQELTMREAAERALVTVGTWSRAEDPEAYNFNPRLNELLLMAAAVDLDLGAALSDPWVDSDPPPEPF